MDNNTGKKIKNAEQACAYARTLKGLAANRRVSLFYDPLGKQFYHRTQGKEKFADENELIAVYRGKVRARDIIEDIEFARRQR
ncbi:hypothetical protein CPT_Silvanus_042 [Stenotrophomonas phage Silvanus]|nr:hypothetical protein CPT_Silvanus_042 [Stenotrophomonas phage Silvanus]